MTDLRHQYRDLKFFVAQAGHSFKLIQRAVIDAFFVINKIDDLVGAGSADRGAE